MSADDSPSGGLSEAAAWRVASRTVLLIFGLGLLMWTATRLTGVLAQLLLAIIISAGMTPLVNRLAPALDLQPGADRRRRKAPRALVVLVLYLLLLSGIGLAGALLIPPAAREVRELTRRLPAYSEQFQAWLANLPDRYSFLPAEFGRDLPSQLQAGASQLQNVLSQALTVVGLLLDVVGGALNFVFILFLALYMTVDSDRIMRYLIDFLPPDRRPQAADVAHRIGARLGGWVRGQILLSAIIGGLTLVGLSLIGVRYAIVLSVIAAIGEAVPMVGPIFSAIPAVIVAFFQSPVDGFLTLGLYVVIQQIENALVVPKVMERAVSLHPLAVMLALLIGGQLFGVTGAILSVPVAAALAVVVAEVKRGRNQATLATAGPSGTPLAGAASPAAVPPAAG